MKNYKGLKIGDCVKITFKINSTVHHVFVKVVDKTSERLTLEYYRNGCVILKSSYHIDQFVGHDLELIDEMQMMLMS